MTTRSDLLTSEEAGAVLGISPKTVRELRRQGKLAPAGSHARPLLFSREEIERYARQRRDPKGRIVALLAARPEAQGLLAASDWALLHTYATTNASLDDLAGYAGVTRQALHQRFQRLMKEIEQG